MLEIKNLEIKKINEKVEKIEENYVKELKNLKRKFDICCICQGNFYSLGETEETFIVEKIEDNLHQTECKHFLCYKCMITLSMGNVSFKCPICRKSCKVFVE